MTSLPRVSAILAGLLLAACAIAPPTTVWRFELAGKTDWIPGGPTGLQANLHGANFRVDLASEQTRIEVVAENATESPLDIRVGPVGAAPRQAIGELLLRPLGVLPGTGGPDMQPYTSQQTVRLEPGWSARFFLDEPLGRPPALGQNVVLSVEASNPKGEVLRRTLPLRANRVGVAPQRS